MKKILLIILSLSIYVSISAKDNEVLTVGMNELPSSLDPPTDWAICERF